MNADELGFLLRYDAWATEQVMTTCEELTAEQFTAEAGPGHTAPRGAIVHLSTGMRTWRERLQGLRFSAQATEAEYPTLGEAREFWRTEHALLEQYVAGLSEPQLNEVIEQRRPDRLLRAPRWQYVVHLTYHHMQHRSELAQALTLLGHSPGELGMTVFLQQNTAATNAE